MSALAWILACAAAQEPAPPPVPPPERPAVSMEEVLAAIEQLRRSYDGADLRVREAVETPARNASQRAPNLAAAESALAALVQDMERLLELLPEPEKSSSSSGSSSSGGDPSEQQSAGEQDRQQPQDGRGTEEQPSGRGPVPPPTGPPLSGQPLPGYARWGLLPPRLQEALRNSSATDVPLRYRRWLEEYHRRGSQPR